MQTAYIDFVSHSNLLPIFTMPFRDDCRPRVAREEAAAHMLLLASDCLWCAYATAEGLSGRNYGCMCICQCIFVSI